MPWVKKSHFRLSPGAQKMMPGSNGSGSSTHFGWFLVFPMITKHLLIHTLRVDFIKSPYSLLTSWILLWLPIIYSLNTKSMYWKGYWFPLRSLLAVCVIRRSSIHWRVNIDTHSEGRVFQYFGFLLCILITDVLSLETMLFQAALIFLFIYLNHSYAQIKIN